MQWAACPDRRYVCVCVCVCVCVRDCVFVCLCLGPSGPVDATTLADGSNNGIGEREQGRKGEKCVRLKELV